eukprot:COSAG01_NODE_190_length_22595_cov_16.442301_3_plen_88_part_00
MPWWLSQTWVHPYAMMRTYANLTSFSGLWLNELIRIASFSTLPAPLRDPKVETRLRSTVMVSSSPSPSPVRSSPECTIPPPKPLSCL